VKISAGGNKIRIASLFLNHQSINEVQRSGSLAFGQDPLFSVIAGCESTQAARTPAIRPITSNILTYQKYVVVCVGASEVPSQDWPVLLGPFLTYNHLTKESTCHFSSSRFWRFLDSLGAQLRGPLVAAPGSLRRRLRPYRNRCRRRSQRRCRSTTPAQAIYKAE